MAREIEHDARPRGRGGSKRDEKRDPNLENAGALHEEPAFAAQAEADARRSGALQGADPPPDEEPRPREGRGGQHVNLGREEPFSSAARVEVDSEAAEEER